MAKVVASVMLERAEARGIQMLAAMETLAGRPITVSALIRGLVREELKSRQGELKDAVKETEF